MWPRRAHILAPLTKLCGSKHKFNWTDIHESSSHQAKQLVAEDLLLGFPDHTLPFEIFTDASAFQIGATVKQKNLPIAYFSKKLTPTQRQYITIEQEMLAIVEVLHEYRNFLLGSNITIYTDHKNLLSNAKVNNRVFRWKQKIQEFGPVIKYIKGHNNIEANTLSRLPMDENMVEVMLNHQLLEPHNPLLNKNPLDLMFIKSHQDKDMELQKAVQDDKTFFVLTLRDIELIYHQTHESNSPKIVITNAIQYAAVRWMHSLLEHAGITRISATFKNTFGFLT